MRLNIINKLLFGICLLLFAVGMNSCELFGLPLQEDYEYKGRIPDVNINMTAFEYIEKNKEAKYSTLYQAIKYLELEDEYKTEKRTYIIMSDLCFSSFLKNQKVTNIYDLKKDYLEKVLKGQIILDEYNSYDLTTTPILVETLDETTALYLSLRDAAVYETDKYQIRINNVPASSKSTTVVTSNIHATNGYIHVIDYTYYIMSK